MKTQEPQKENRGHKSDNKILSTYFDVKRLYYGNNMHPYIFMPELEERYIYPLIKNKSSRYLRFIDDIFMVWTKSENEFKFFIN